MESACRDGAAGCRNEAMRRCWPSSSRRPMTPTTKTSTSLRESSSGGSPTSAGGLIRRIEWRSIAERRRRNYRRLADIWMGLRACRVIRPEVSDFTCPLVLPIEVDHSERVSVVAGPAAHQLRRLVERAPSRRSTGITSLRRPASRNACSLCRCIRTCRAASRPCGRRATDAA